jgi:Domain of unknown function (DUF5666)
MQKIKVIPIILFLTIACLAQEDSSKAVPPKNQDARNQEGGMGGRRRPAVVGTITELNDSSMTVKTISGQLAKVALPSDTRFFKDRQAAKASDFKVGDMVVVRGESTGENTWKAEMVASRPGGSQEFREGLGKRFIVGELKSVDGVKLTIARPDGVVQTIAVDETTSFRKEGESITLADLHSGDHVMGRGEIKDGVFAPSILVVGDAGMMPFGPPPQNSTPDSRQH